MKTDYAPEMMLLVVYVPREELPQEEVDMRCVEYASHKLPYHTNYTGKDLNQVDRFVAMLRRQFTRIYSRANRLPFDESIWKGEYKARRLDSKALGGILGEEAIGELEAKLGRQRTRMPEGAPNLREQAGDRHGGVPPGAGGQGGAEGQEAPKFELSKSNFEVPRQAGGITHVDFIDVFDMTVLNGERQLREERRPVRPLFKFPSPLRRRVLHVPLEVRHRTVGNYLFDRLGKRKAKPKKKPKPKKARCPAAAG